MFLDDFGLNRKVTEKVIFFDQKGNVEEKEIQTNDEDALEQICQATKEMLENRWNSEVIWRKVDPITNEVILKVEINMEKENEFVSYLEKEELKYEKIKYTSTLFIWQIDCPYHYPIETIESLSYVKSMEYMPFATLD